jgi:hypothetical protein
MAQYGSDQVVVKIDVTDGGALTDITQFVQTINGIDIEKILEVSHTFGDAWEESTPVGVSKMAPVVLGGIYDDGANVSAAFFTNAHTQTRTLEITYGSTKKTTVEVWINKRKRMPARNALTRYEVTLQPSGAATDV